MEKRLVTITIGGQRCSFYSDDSDEYISALEQRANEIMRQTARFSLRANALLSVISLTDSLMREEKKTEEKKSEETEGAVKAEPKPEPKTEPKAGNKRNRKNAASTPEENQDQISVWDLLERKPAEAAQDGADGADGTE